LRSLRGAEIRPTSDRLRETLFNVLTAGNPATLEGSVWIDLFAGTGAVGIEALSRGAGMVYFVESSASAAALIASNLKSLKIESGFQVLKSEVAHASRKLAAERVKADVVFLDPPYRLEAVYGETLRVLAGSSILKSGTVVIAEHQKKFDPGESFGELLRFRRLDQGDASLSFYRIADS
jgi:16S rRNA (guanine966-N2)-methyltransferase